MAYSSYGYSGNILRVDLTTASWADEDSGKYRDWLGGSGVGQRILYEETKPWMNPFDPMNILTFGTGPLTGTLMPTSSRLSADSKSPLTMGVGTSNSGGYFASELKFAGYDHLVLKGKARKPVYIWINDGKIQIRDASYLWGRTTWETEDLIKEELGDGEIEILSIGPAGENLVRGASIIINKNRAQARCGLGAVMGSKNLKAIAVKGTGEVRLAHPERFMETIEGIRKIYDSSKFTEAMFKYGTAMLTDPKYNSGAIPYKNFQDLDIPEQLYQDLRPQNIVDNYKDGQSSCLSCPLACVTHFFINSGRYAGLKTVKMEFEPMVNYSAKLGIDDVTFCIKANSLCNQLGMDVDLPAQTVAWAMECYEKGLLSAEHFDGLKPVWGDAGVTEALLKKIAYREGVGNILAEGVARAADIMGEETKYYAMNLKGQDLYEPLRFAVGWALGACTSTRGGGHVTGTPWCEVNTKMDPQVARKKFGIDTFAQPLAWEGKEYLVRYHEILHRLNNSLGICHQGTDCTDINYPGFEELAELYSAATGIEKSSDEMQKTALKILNLEKAYNIKHAGFGRAEDYPPKRMMNEAVPSGPVKGFRLDKEKYDKLLDNYYTMHGWDKETGHPTRERLLELGLEDVAEDLYGQWQRKRTNINCF